jgi:hypothetical protein
MITSPCRATSSTELEVAKRFDRATPEFQHALLELLRVTSRGSSRRR